jgi:hypothetical protein
MTVMGRSQRCARRRLSRPVSSLRALASLIAKASHLREEGFQLLPVFRGELFDGESGVDEDTVTDGDVVDEIEADFDVGSARTGDGKAVPVNG